MDRRLTERMNMTECYKTNERKQKRVDRSKDRLAIHQKRLLDNFVRGVESGYAHENWVGITCLYKQISDFLAPEEYAVLGKIWRESFVGPQASTRLDVAINLIKKRIDDVGTRNY